MAFQQNQANNAQALQARQEQYKRDFSAWAVVSCSLWEPMQAAVVAVWMRRAFNAQNNAQLANYNAGQAEQQCQMLGAGADSRARATNPPVSSCFRWIATQALCFSAEKIHSHVLYLLRAQWPDLYVVWVNTGAAYRKPSSRWRAFGQWCRTFTR